MWHREISDLSRAVEKARLVAGRQPAEVEAIRTRELILEYLEHPRSTKDLAEFTGMHKEGIYRHTIKLCNARLAEKVRVGKEVYYQRRAA